MPRKRNSANISDDEDYVFDLPKMSTRHSHHILKSPSKERKIDEDDEHHDDDDDDDEELMRILSKGNKGNQLNNINNDNTKSGGSLKMRFRRSTEQSNYKIEQPKNDLQERRASLRSSTLTPTRFRSADEITEFNQERRMHLRKTPQRCKTPESKVLRSNTSRTAEKLKSLRISKENLSDIANDNKENESDDYISDIDDNLELITNRRTRASRKVIDTPSKKTKGHHLEISYKNKPVDHQETLRKNEVADHQETPQKQAETPKRRTRASRAHLETPKQAYLEIPKRAQFFNEEAATPKRKSIAPKIGTPSVKVGMLTPSLKHRTANVGKPKTVLEEARAQLHVSAVPKSLPCREKEFNDIFMFLEKKIADHSSGCMYISGVPGTGKTATVNEVIRCLKKLNSKGSLSSFDFIEINGMKLSEPRQSYVQILKQMTGKSTTWEEALKLLDKRFTNSANKKSMTLLLIDELDILCNKRQDVVYNLLNWPSQPSAQLVVITIANTMDLPERVLMSRVTSRLGLTRLTFQPYNHKQLNEIVIARLNESVAFRSEAVQLVARKVAAVSGDARRALDICRRATEIAELHESKIVSLQHVNEALTEMIASVKVRAIKHCSEMEKVFLQAVCAEITRTGVEETTFINVYKQLEALCSFEGVPIPTVTQGLEICNRLSAKRLIIVDDPRSDILQRIFLNVSSDDVHFALQDIEL